jgi:hypothetical protein
MATTGGAVTCTRDEAVESLRAELGETGEGLTLIQTDV